MDTRHLADIQALLRELNDRINVLMPRFLLDGEAAQTFICECGRAGCTEWVTVTISDYEAIRDQRARVLVAAGHEEPAPQHASAA
jgi:hypothetical protein